MDSKFQKCFIVNKSKFTHNINNTSTANTEKPKRKYVSKKCKESPVKEVLFIPQPKVNKNIKVYKSSRPVFTKQPKEVYNSIKGDFIENNLPTRCFSVRPSMSSEKKSINSDKNLLIDLIDINHYNEVIENLEAKKKALVNEINNSLTLIEWNENIFGLVSDDDFIKCMDIYENNQNYISVKLKNAKTNHEIEKYENLLLSLEKWFYLIIDMPNTKDKILMNSSIERELSKLNNYHTFFCKQDFIPIVSKYIKEDYVLIEDLKYLLTKAKILF